MILFRYSPSGREEIGEVVERSSLGEVFVRLPNGSKRWIPANWIIEEES